MKKEIENETVSPTKGSIDDVLESIERAMAAQGKGAPALPRPPSLLSSRHRIKLMGEAIRIRRRRDDDDPPPTPSVAPRPKPPRNLEGGCGAALDYALVA